MKSTAITMKIPRPAAQQRVTGKARTKPRTKPAVQPETREIGAGTVIALVIGYPKVTGNHAVKHARGRHYRVPAAVAYRQRVATEVRQQGLGGYGVKPLRGPLAVRVTACPPDGIARDTDNLLKEVYDALTHAGFWVDDSNKVIRRHEFTWLPALKDGAISVAVSAWTP